MTSSNPHLDPKMLGMLAGFDAEAESRIALRARRSVLSRLLRSGEQRIRRRHNYGLALAAALTVLVLIAPVIWMAVDEFLSSEHPANMAPQMALVLVLFTSGLFAALVAGLRENLRRREGTRRR